jgi:tRNA-dihydrouridine synthase
VLSDEFKHDECPFADNCKYEHDLRKYLHEKSSDLKALGGRCPVFDLHGFCPAGWKCCFIGSHSKEVVREDLEGRKELVLIIDPARFKEDKITTKEDVGLYNAVDKTTKMELNRRRVQLDRSDAYTAWVTESVQVEADARRKQAAVLRDELSPISDVDDTRPDVKNTTDSASQIHDDSKTVETDATTAGERLGGFKDKGTALPETDHAGQGHPAVEHSGDVEVTDAKPEADALVNTDGWALGTANAEAIDKGKGHALDDAKDDAQPEPILDADPKTRSNDPRDASNEKTIVAKSIENEADSKTSKMDIDDERAAYVEPPFRASEKRRLYYGPETPILAPLTTQGNLPFRRLCVQLGAQLTFSEMALGLPLIQGANPEWALMKAHESEITPPAVSSNASTVVPGYDNAKDLKFGVQIAAGKPWIAFKTTEIIAKYCPYVRAIDLNSGCPIDLVCNMGAGSSLLDQPSKLEKILRGMNALSGEIPITLKIRTGTKDNAPTADSLVKRMLFGGRQAQDAGLGPTGIAAITLHGRSRQQRYTRLADWEYIADIAALIRAINKTNAEKTDTAAEPDARDLPNGGKVLFVGNGDILSHEDYQAHIEKDLVDSAMIGRGALLKPWIFEEIAAGQYLDKSPTERLGYVEDFVRYGLDTWGADERGVQTTRRFLLEWLSFTHRYVPVGLLERLPPKINERPPPFRGRSDAETMLASENYDDWIRISEMYLGPAERNFRFQPKHKSNSYAVVEG